MTDKNQKTIRRHRPAAMFIHWFNAVCWFFLLATGLGLIGNQDLAPIGTWWPELMRSVFGGGGNLLLAHEIAAGVWLAVWVVFALLGAKRYTVPFLVQILSIKPKRDMEWTIKKNIQMTLGYKKMAQLVKPLGWDGRIPDQPFYNAGQKLAAQAIVAGALALVATGIIMTMSKYVLTPAEAALVQWSITIHFVAAGLTTAMLLIHIYMAAISIEERPAFWSMFTGRVPVDYAQHHHKLWFDQVKQ